MGAVAGPSRRNGTPDGINDLWIAAIAVSRGLPVITRDDDFAVLDGANGFTAIQV